MMRAAGCFGWSLAPVNVADQFDRARPMESSDALGVLESILNIGEERAAQLLAVSEGNIETAVALHFAAGQADATTTGQDSPRGQLRAIVGGSQVSLQQAAALLRRSGGSVEAAADLFFRQQEEAGPSRAAREQSEPISIDSDRCD
jgi:hypothetical protein